MRLLVISLFILMGSDALYAADWAREKRWEAEIIDTILDGEALKLSDGERDFLAIFTKTELEYSDKAVLIIHGRGYHPDWVDTVHPLRTGLADHGWNTLSIQMPVLAKDARYYDYVEIFDEAIPRIAAAIDYLDAQGKKKIVLIAHSCGVHMSMHYLKNKGDEGLEGFIGIGMSATDYRQPMLEPFPLRQLTIPVLDIYGADDYPAVHRLAPERWSQIQQAGHIGSIQQVIPSANHNFTGRGDVLVRAITDWLNDLKLQ